MTEHPRILIPINRGHMARLLVYSGVIDLLVKMGAHVIVLTPRGASSPLRVHLPESVTIQTLPLPGLRFSNRWNRLFFYLYQTSTCTSSSQARLEVIKAQQPLRYALMTKSPPALLKRFRAVLISVRRIVLDVNRYASVFSENQPDLVLAGTLGRNLEDYYLIRYARLNSIRTIGTIQSWDTLTTKEYGFERPERLTVWNPKNRSEAVRLFHYREADIAVVGVPHFDIYVHRKNTDGLSRAQWLMKNNLQEQREVLLVTGQGGHVHQNLTEVVEALADGISNHSFVKPVQVLVRPHPAVYFGVIPGQGTEEDLRLFETMSPFIKANRPIRSAVPIMVDTDPSEHETLAEHLFHSSVLVDFFGTLAIEACVMDRPVVFADVRSSFAANCNGQQKEGVSGQIDYKKYEHLNYIFEFNGTKIAYNRNQLFEFINLYLEDPVRDGEGRQAIAQAFCHKLDGRSAERMARVLYDYARGIWPPSSIE